jgi:hypothetical protein
MCSHGLKSVIESLSKCSEEGIDSSQTLRLYIVRVKVRVLKPMTRFTTSEMYK